MSRVGHILGFVAALSSCKSPGPLASETLATQGGYQEVGALVGHSSGVLTMAFHPVFPDIVVSGGMDGRVIAWDLRTKEKLWELKGRCIFQNVVFTADGKIIAATGSRGVIVLINSQTGELIRTLEGHAGSIETVAVSPDGTRAATGSTDATVMLWNLQTGEDTHLWANRDGWVVKTLAFSGDGKRLYAGAIETLRIWSVESKVLIREVVLPGGWIEDMSLSPDGVFVAVTGSFDGKVQVLDTEAGDVELELIGHTSDVNSVEFAKDMRHLMTGSRDGTIRKWDMTTGVEVDRIPYEGFPLFKLKISDDDKVLLTTDVAKIRVWKISPSDGGPP